MTREKKKKAARRERHAAQGREGVASKVRAQQTSVANDTARGWLTTWPAAGRCWGHAGHGGRGGWDWGWGLGADGKRGYWDGDEGRRAKKDKREDNTVNKKRVEGK